MTQAIVKGSIQDIAKTGDTALALLDAKIVLICDRSGSMAYKDAMGGRARYEVEDDIVKDLQAKYPGQIVLIAFGDYAALCLNGELPYPNSSETIMSYAFKLAATLTQVGMRAILLSDGEASDSEKEIFNSARDMLGSLDVVYIGADLGPGKKLMERLAAVVRGTLDYNDLKNPNLLKGLIERKLLESGNEK